MCRRTFCRPLDSHNLCNVRHIHTQSELTVGFTRKLEMGVTLFLFLASLQATTLAVEYIQVVTPETNADARVNLTERADELSHGETDSYLLAYKELHKDTADRRTPEVDEQYNTISLSSPIDDDVYPNFINKVSRKPPHRHHHHHHYHPVIYGPPAPVTVHKPEQVSGHHGILNFPIGPSLEIIHSFLSKFGIHTVYKLIIKIMVLKLVLKFISVVTLFFLIPALMPKDEKDDRQMMDELDNMTEIVMHGIAEGEEQNKPSEEPDDIMDMDMDMDVDVDADVDTDMEIEEMIGEEEEEEVKPEVEEAQHEEHSEKPSMDHDKHEEMDDELMELLEKVVKAEKDDLKGGPNKETAIKILESCVSMANRVLGFMLGHLKMKNNNMDVLDSVMFDKLSWHLKRLMKMWWK